MQGSGLEIPGDHVDGFLMRALRIQGWAAAAAGVGLLAGCSSAGWNRYPGLGWMMPGKDRLAETGGSSGEEDHPEVRQVSGPVRAGPGHSPSALAPSGGAPSPIVRGAEHYVLPGQTLSEISRRYGISVEAIKAANGLQDDQIRAGDWLRIPAR